MQVKQEYGIHNECLIHISESESKKIYLCPCCNSELIAKKGKIKIHHFSHKNLDACGGALETSLHIMAKEILSQSNTILLPINFKHNNLFDYQIKTSDFGVELIYDSVVVEKKVDDIIPDLILYSNGFPLLVEIKVTHGIDEIKLEKIEQINIPLIEISIDYKKNDATTKEFLEMILFKSTIEKSVIRSPQDCFDRIVLMNEMDFFISNVNLKNQTIILPTKKYFTFRKELTQIGHYHPGDEVFAFLIATDTEIVVNDFKIINKDYTNGYLYVEISIGDKNVLCVFSFKDYFGIPENLIKTNPLKNLYNSILFVRCNSGRNTLNLMNIYELLKKERAPRVDKYFIKNIQIDILKNQLYYQVKKDMETKNSIKIFAHGGEMHGKQTYGHHCPKTNRKATFRNCKKCNSLIKLKELQRCDIIVCGEGFKFKQVIVDINEFPEIDIGYGRDFAIDI